MQGPPACVGPESGREAPDNHGTYRVLVRARPPLGIDLGGHDQLAVEVLSSTRLRVARPEQEALELQVDRALGPRVGQAEVFRAVKDVVSGVADGKCGTVLAYGQTGSGKTHTMIGELPSGSAPCSKSGSSQSGLIPLALEHLFGHVVSKRRSSWHAYVSFMEIYNEKVYDLLLSPRALPNGSSLQCGGSAGSRSGTPRRDAPRRPASGLDVLEGRDGAVSVPGLTVVEVCSLEQALEVVKIGTASRTSGDNGVNPTSSRSHAIFQFILERSKTAHSGQQLQVTKLNFVDLAGSEKLQPSSSTVAGPLLQELTCINLSLSALGQCIAALVDARRTHVPYRDSKLTRLLQDSLRGRSTTVMCVCISPMANPQLGSELLEPDRFV